MGAGQASGGRLASCHAIQAPEGSYQGGSTPLCVSSLSAAHPLLSPTIHSCVLSPPFRSPPAGGGMTVAFNDTNLLCDMLRPLPNLSNKVATSGEAPLPPAPVAQHPPQPCPPAPPCSAACVPPSGVCMPVLGCAAARPAVLLPRHPQSVRSCVPRCSHRRRHLRLLRAPQAPQRDHQHPGECAVQGEQAMNVM